MDLYQYVRLFDSHKSGKDHGEAHMQITYSELRTLAPTLFITFVIRSKTHHQQR